MRQWCHIGALYIYDYSEGEPGETFAAYTAKFVQGPELVNQICVENNWSYLGRNYSISVFLSFIPKSVCTHDMTGMAWRTGRLQIERQITVAANFSWFLCNSLVVGVNRLGGRGRHVRTGYTLWYEGTCIFNCIIAIPRRGAPGPPFHTFTTKRFQYFGDGTCCFHGRASGKHFYVANVYMLCCVSLSLNTTHLQVTMEWPSSLGIAPASEMV